MVDREEYLRYVELAQYFAILLLIAIVVATVFACLWWWERTKRQELATQIERLGDPTHETAIIGRVGEAARQEVRRAVAEANRAMASFAEVGR